MIKAALLSVLMMTACARADVYVGTAFGIRDFVDRPNEWSDVRAHATGYYFHPRSGNEASELKGLEQKRITDLFASRRAITERNNGGQDDGDRPQYELMRDCGMTPVAGLVAEVNALAPWQTRVARSMYRDASGNEVRVPLVADQRPWTSAWNKTADWTHAQVESAAASDDELTMRLAIMTGGAGFALETDNNRSFVDGHMDPTSKHFKICRQMLGYAQSKRQMTMLFLHGFEEADAAHYVESNLAFLRAIEDAGVYPDVLICSFYTSGSKVKLLPETTSIDGHPRVPAETLSGLAWATLAREGAIPLRDDERPRVTTIQGDGGTLMLRLENLNPAIDFAPAITVAGGEGVAYAFGDAAFAPLPADGAIAFVAEHRLLPGSTQTLRLRCEHGTARLSYRDHAFARLSPTRELGAVVGR